MFINLSKNEFPIYGTHLRKKFLTKKYIYQHFHTMIITIRNIENSSTSKNTEFIFQRK